MAISGSGTQSDPYLVRTYNDLVAAFNAVTTAKPYVKLIADIKYSRYRTWSVPPCVAILDMNNHVISNVVIDWHNSLMPVAECYNGWFMAIEVDLQQNGSPFWTKRADHLNFINCEFNFPSVASSSAYPHGIFEDCVMQYCTVQGTVNFSSAVQGGTAWGKQCVLASQSGSSVARYCKFDLDIQSNYIPLGNESMISLFHSYNSTYYPCDVYNCLIQGRLRYSDVTLNGFVASSNMQRFTGNIVDLDVSQATMSASDPACNIVNATWDLYYPDSNKSIVNTDYFSAAGLHNKVSSGISCIDVSSAILHDRTALNATGWKPNREYIRPTTYARGVFEATVDYKSLSECTGAYPEYEYQAWRQYPNEIPFMYPFNRPHAPQPFPHLYVGNYPVDRVFRGDREITDIYVGSTKL